MNNNDSDINVAFGNNVREILEHLVDHFGQNVHAEVIMNSYSEKNATLPLLSSTTNGPKKEQLEQQERKIPEIVQLWLDRLLSLALRSHYQNPVTDLTTDGNDCDGNKRCRNNDHIIVVLCEWVCGYEEVVRPCIFKAENTSSSFSTMPTFDERCIPVLNNYELVLSKLLLKSMDIEEETSSVSTLVSTIPSSYSKIDLLRIINLLSTDVTLLTAGASDNNQDGCKDSKKDKTNHFRRNVGLPALLQILGNTLEVLRQKISNASPKNNDDDNQTTNLFKEFVPECLGSLRLCAVSILAFDLLDDCDGDCFLALLLSHKLSPSHSMPRACRNNKLTLVQRILERTEISTSDNPSEFSSIVRKYLERALGTDSLSYDDIDASYWSSLLSNSQGFFSSAGWIDSNPNNIRGTLRIIHGIWRSMESLLMTLSKKKCQVHNKTREDLGDVGDEDVSDTKEHRERRTFVLKKLGGPDPLVGDARAHFFGRNLHGIKQLAQRKSKVDDMEMSSVVVKMGRRITKEKKNVNVDGSPINGLTNERVLSRTVAVLNVLRLLLVPEMIEDVNNASRENVLKNIFPICAALLDSNNVAFGALGVAGLLLTIDALAPRGIDVASKDSIPDQNTLYKIGNITDSEAWMNFAENTLTILERSLQSNRDHGHIVVAIGRMQTRLFEIVLTGARRNGNDDIDDLFRRRRRIVTEQWLSKLERSLYRPVTERQQLELLLGGVIPLLSQHAMDEKSEADGIELGRLGLAALLPITTNVTMRLEISKQSTGENIGRKTQMASMVALINLMFAAHPVMARHGGKIMSHLLMAAASDTPLGRSESDSEIEEDNSLAMDSIRNMAILVAAMGLVVCESKFAGQLLDFIENDRDQYEQKLLTVISEVREVATGLMAIL